MKKRLRKTGEIVDVIDYDAFYRTDRDKGDWVSYVDSKGNEHYKEKGLNIYWDFEDVEEELTKEIDWKQVRIDAAIAAMKGILSGESLDITVNDESQDFRSVALVISKAAVLYADALIAELKKGGKDA